MFHQRFTYIMRYLFTTSSDISDGVILTFDLKTRIIRVSSQRRADGFFEEFPVHIGDLFCPSCHHRLGEMAFSDLVFRNEAFDSLVDRLFELTEQDMFDMSGAEETAIEVVVTNYNEMIGSNKSNRSLTGEEFKVVLIGHLYRSLYMKIFRQYLDRDLGIN